jgi:hypothetical protein
MKKLLLYCQNNAMKKPIVQNAGTMGFFINYPGPDYWQYFF